MEVELGEVFVGPRVVLEGSKCSMQPTRGPKVGRTRYHCLDQSSSFMAMSALSILTRSRFTRFRTRCGSAQDTRASETRRAWRFRTASFNNPCLSFPSPAPILKGADGGGDGAVKGPLADGGVEAGLVEEVEVGAPADLPRQLEAVPLRELLCVLPAAGDLKDAPLSLRALALF